MDTLAKVKERGVDGAAIQADVTDPLRSAACSARQERARRRGHLREQRATDFAGTYQKPLEITLEQWQTAVDSQDISTRGTGIGAHE